MDDLIKRAAGDIAGSNYAIALTGAGISTESGISDFRGPQGIWTKNPEAERRAYRSWEEFSADPKEWWRNSFSSKRQFSLDNLEDAQPNKGHYALMELEQIGILKWTITQNIDSLHEKAGTNNLLEFHGSVAKLRCISCNTRYRKEEFDFQQLFEEDKFPPLCPNCQGIIKTDGVFFGEPIPSDVAEQSFVEASKCDLMLICGTSAVVFPFANLPRIARQAGATIIEINAEPTPLTEDMISSYLIRGQIGEILPRLVDEIKKIKGLS
ncbi:NAD-dependent deacetylase [Chloroflexota bacterium]